jgi:gas vesicle protein
MGNGKMLLGVLVGLSTGALLGILFAPAKGTSTRKKIAHRSDEYLSELGEKFDDFIDGISKKFDSAKDEANRLAENGKSKLEDAEGKFRAAVK